MVCFSQHQFKQFLVEEGRKPRTIERHIQNIGVLQEYGIDFSWSVDEIKNQLHTIKVERSLKTNSVNNFISTLRMIGHFTGNRELLFLKYWKISKEEVFEKGILSDQEIYDIVDLPPYHGVSHKDYAMYTLFFLVLSYCGMRPGELARVTVNDINFGLREIRVNQKTGPRDVPMHQAIIEPVQEYIHNLDGPYLFPSKKGGKSRGGLPVIDAAEWGRAFQKRLQILGIKRENISVYSLRHTFCTRYAEEDISLPKIGRIVGHRKIETTMGYLHLVKKDLHEAMKKDRLGRAKINEREFVKTLCDDIDRHELYKDRRFDYSKIEQAKALLWESIKQ